MPEITETQLELVNPKNPSRLGWVQSTVLYASLLLLFLSGIFLGKAFLGIRGNASSSTVIESESLFEEPSQETSAKSDLDFLWRQIHGYSVPIFLLAFGGLLARHVPISWKANRNRLSGVIMVLLCGLIALTGVLLYYVGNESVRSSVLFLHFWLGFSILPFILFHIIMGISSRRK